MDERGGTPLDALTPLDRIAESLLLVDRAMRDQLASEGQIVSLMGDHVLSSGGKRLRPAIMILAAELCGYTGPRRIQVAAAVELLHTATLLHDDVVDLSRLRRGKASANAVWGNRRAVLVGDFFYARASTMIVEDGDIDILWVFSNTIRHMAEGELLQLQQSFDPTVTEQSYFAIIDRKSAALLAAASEAGAILAGVTRAERRRVADFGRELGLAFQLRDDALDYCAAPDSIGKMPCADLREGKVTLPLLLALKRSTAAERDGAAAVLKAAARRSAEFEAEGAPAPEKVLADGDLESVLNLVERYHGVEDTNRRAEEHVTRAAAAIAPFPECRAKEALLDAAHFAVARES